MFVDIDQDTREQFTDRHAYIYTTTRIHKHAHAYVHSHVHSCVRVHVHVRVHIHAHANAHVRAHTQTFPCTSAYADARMQAYIYS